MSEQAGKTESSHPDFDANNICYRPNSCILDVCNLIPVIFEKNLASMAIFSRKNKQTLLTHPGIKYITSYLSKYITHDQLLLSKSEIIPLQQELSGEYFSILSDHKINLFDVPQETLEQSSQLFAGVLKHTSPDDFVVKINEDKKKSMAESEYEQSISRINLLGVLKMGINQIECSRLFGFPFWSSRLTNQAIEIAFNTIRHDSKSTIDAHLVVQKEVEQAIATTSGPLLQSTVFSMPPVESLLLRHAEIKDQSLLDAAADLRDSPEATAYRKWLGELQKDISSQSRGSLLRADGHIKEMKNVISEWGHRADLDYGIKYKPREISLKSIPIFGKLLDAVGLSKLSIKDPILTKAPGHLQFIASWYSE